MSWFGVDLEHLGLVLVRGPESGFAAALRQQQT